MSAARPLISFAPGDALTRSQGSAALDDAMTPGPIAATMVMMMAMIGAESLRMHSNIGQRPQEISG